MQINLNGVIPSNFLSEVGTHTLKVISVKDEKNKGSYEPELHVTMQSKSGEMYTEKFLMRDTMIWKIAQFVDALKLPMQELDSNVFVGRYVTGQFENEAYTNTRGEAKTSFKAKSWIKSKMQTETVPPKQERKVEVVHETIPQGSIDNEEIPF